MKLSELSEKAAYIKGLADGLGLDDTTKEGKVIAALIELVGEMADEIEAINEDVDNLGEYIEEIDEDLESAEDMLYGDYEEDDCDDCDGDCDNCDCDCDCDDDEFFEVVCPSCGETICFDGSIDPEELACPACGEKFECIVSEDELEALDGADEE